MGLVKEMWTVCTKIDKRPQDVLRMEGPTKDIVREEDRLRTEENDG